MGTEQAQGRGGEVVSAKLTLSGGKSVTGKLAEVGARSITIALDRSSAGHLQAGQRVQFTLSGELVGGSHDAQGNVIEWRDNDDQISCTIRYRDEDNYTKLLATGVGRRFNRRGSFRVASDERNPIGLEMKGSFGTVTARALDISATGIGLVLHDAQELPMGETVEMVVTLPDEENAVRVPAKLCHRRDTGEFVMYGVDYSEVTNRAMEIAVERIESFVMRRQREELRSKQ